MGCACFQGTSKQYNSSFQKTMYPRKTESRDLIEIKKSLGETMQVKVFKKPHKNNKNYYVYVISPQNWLRILDFLNYSDLKESGKTNRYINIFIF
jgi:hypothetical protein